MAILSTTDFAGKWQIANDQYSQADLQQYITDQTPSLMAKLFGAELSKLILADIGGGSVPNDPLYLAVFNPFIEDNDQCCYEPFEGVIESKGVKQYLVGMIYFYFMKDKRLKPASATGSTTVKVENSVNGNTLSSVVYDRYNEAVNTANAIQWYCMKNRSDYPDFNGQEILYNYYI